MKPSKHNVCIVAALSLMTSVFGAEITLSNGETRALNDGNIYVIPENASVTLSGNLGWGGRIRMANNATVRLKGLNVLYPDDSYAIFCSGNGTIILVDGTKNKVKGGSYKYETVNNGSKTAYSAISVYEGYTLTIKGETEGTGEMTAVGGYYDTISAAGIGSASRSVWYTTGHEITKSVMRCGNIVIEGGVVNAEGGGSDSAGIGSGSDYSQCGNITIKDTITKIVAKIGRGSTYDWSKSYCGTVTIGSHLNQTVNNGVTTITPMTYTIGFNANGGHDNTSKTLRYGAALGALPVPTRTGYTLSGWFTTASGGSQISQQTTVSANITYYAHWAANSYTISYDANGGSGTMAPTVANYDNDVTLSGCNFTRYAKQFAGWATEADGQVVYSAGQTVSNLTAEPNGTITLYAVWETLVVPSAQASTTGGTTFCGDSYTVTLSCPLDGATIYYTTNGVTPRLSASFAYTDPIVIYGSADIVAIAVKDGERSGYTRVSITQITPDAPVIVPADGAKFRSATCEVTISCATDGAEIYYTIDGSTPQKENGTKYTAPFTIADTTTVKTIAIGGPFKSEVVTATISKRTLSLPEAAGMIELAFDTDENAPWCPIVDASSTSGFAAQSGTIGMDASTWMETSVRGAGTFSFKWRVECEKDDSGGVTWDRLAVFTNAIEAARIDGVTEWQNVSFAFGDEGKHTIRWEFMKDDYDEEGAAFADNAWVSGVSWISNDPIPAIEESAELGWALSLVQDKERLSSKLSTVAKYQAFRSWVDNKELSHAVVRDAPNAWLSYALDASGLMAKATPLASEDVAIESIEPSSVASGAFDLVVDIVGEEIGEGAKLAEVFGVEGATELNESAFSSEGLTVNLQRTADGKAKATVTPDGTPPTFFLRVKVK